MDKEFYVYVSSENAPDSMVKSIAVNDLPLSIDTVNKQWEVSLINSNITISWNNLTEAVLEITKSFDTPAQTIQVIVPPGHYIKTENLYNAINHAIDEKLSEFENRRNW